MRVLALDLGRRTGWTLGDENGYLDSGVHELYSERAGREFSDGERFDALHEFLDKFSDLDAVVYENVGGGTKGRQTVLWNGYRAILLRWAMRRDLTVISYTPGEIKKHATGKGNATKDEMIAAAVNYGKLPYDDNEADAICMYYFWKGTQSC